MIITVLIKDPDGIGNALDLQIKNKNLKDEIINKFFEYGEYCCIEIDTEALQAKVIPNSKV